MKKIKSLNQGLLQKGLVPQWFYFFFNHKRFQSKKKNHIFRFIFPITTNTSIIRPFFYHQNEAIKFFDPQLWPSKLCDDINLALKIHSLYLNLWPYNVKHLMNQKRNMWKLLCMLCPPNQGVIMICWFHR